MYDDLYNLQTVTFVFRVICPFCKSIICRSFVKFSNVFGNLLTKLLISVRVSGEGIRSQHANAPEHHTRKFCHLGCLLAVFPPLPCCAVKERLQMEHRHGGRAETQMRAEEQDMLQRRKNNLCKDLDVNTVEK